MANGALLATGPAEEARLLQDARTSAEEELTEHDRHLGNGPLPEASSQYKTRLVAGVLGAVLLACVGLSAWSYSSLSGQTSRPTLRTLEEDSEAKTCLDKEWSQLMDEVDKCAGNRKLRFTQTGIMVDIHRGHWKTLSRGYGKYLSRFETSLKAWASQEDIGGIFLVDEEAAKTAKKVLEDMDATDPGRFCLVPVTMDNLPPTVCLHERLVEAIPKQKMAALGLHQLNAILQTRNDPEWQNAAYNEVMLAKGMILGQAGKRNPFQSEAISSLDLGTHVLNFVDDVKKYGPFDIATCGEKGEKMCLPIVECERLQRMHKKYSSDFLAISLDGNGVLDGGAISGSPEACEKGYPLFVDVILEKLNKGFTQDDQPYWVDVGLHHPDRAFFFDASGAADKKLEDHWIDGDRQIAFSKTFKREECRLD